MWCVQTDGWILEGNMKQTLEQVVCKQGKHMATVS